MVDMHIGNIPQGFVASGYTGITMGRYVAAGGYNVPYELPQQNRQYKIMNLKEGMVKDSKLGFNAYGTGSYVEVSNVYWNNVPLYSDYDLGGVLKLDIRDHT